MKQEPELFSIGTHQIDCENVRIMDITEDSILISDREGRKLELDFDAIERFTYSC